MIDNEAARIRARLAQVGLLAETTPVSWRPGLEQVIDARRRVGEGVTLADIVARDRG